MGKKGLQQDYWPRACTCVGVHTCAHAYVLAHTHMYTPVHTYACACADRKMGISLKIEDFGDNPHFTCAQSPSGDKVSVY